MQLLDQCKWLERGLSTRSIKVYQTDRDDYYLDEVGGVHDSGSDGHQTAAIVVNVPISVVRFVVFGIG